MGFDMMRHYVATLSKKSEIAKEALARLFTQMELLLKKFNESAAEISAGLLEGSGEVTDEILQRLRIS